MICGISGKLTKVTGNRIAVEVGGIVYRVFVPVSSVASLPKAGERVSLFTFLYTPDGAPELYGFLREEELEFFEALISVSGIGPKSALGIISVASLEKLKAAISQGKAELLQQSSGIGKKTAERIVLELRDKLVVRGGEEITGLMESDRDIVEALVSLGYPRGRAKEVVASIGADIVDTGDRLREALKKIKQ